MSNKLENNLKTENQKRIFYKVQAVQSELIKRALTYTQVKSWSLWDFPEAGLLQEMKNTLIT
jgi:hypothetical protein